MTHRIALTLGGGIGLVRKYLPSLHLRVCIVGLLLASLAAIGMVALMAGAD